MADSPPFPGDEPPPPASRGCLRALGIGVLVSTAISVVGAAIAWKVLSDAAEDPAKALVQGLGQVMGAAPTGEVERATQDLAKALEAVAGAVEAEAQQVVVAVAATVDGGGATDAAAVQWDAAIRVKVTPPPANEPMVWYDDNGQAHITLPEAVPMKQRRALGWE